MNVLTRRAFLKLAKRLLTGVGLASILGPIIAYFFPTELEEQPADPIVAGPAAELPVGAAKLIRFGRYPALLINTAAGLRAYSAVCTHFACIVNWDPASGQIVCPCHVGIFNPLDGSVLAGPPPAPLEALKVTVKDDQIIVST